MKAFPSCLLFVSIKKYRGLMSSVFWQRMKDLNPHKRSQSPVCYHYTNPLNAYAIITILDEGFEPSQTESESGVLPLHKSAKRICYYNDFKTFVKS